MPQQYYETGEILGLTNPNHLVTIEDLALSGFTGSVSGSTLNTLLTGFASSGGTISSGDTVLTAFNKLDGNDATKAPIVGKSSIIANSSGITTGETIITLYVIPANTLIVGTTYKIECFGTCTSSVANASNFRIRIGTAGTSSDAVAAVVTPTAAASGTNVPFSARFYVTIRTTGVGGTLGGNGTLINNGVTGVSAAATVVGTPQVGVTVNTTVANTIQLSYVSAAITTASTFNLATIELVKA
jgi:hypothetical protein